MWHNGMPGCGMDYGWMLVLLAIAADVNYLFFDN